ncbi:MAG: methyltransferase [Alphaproteobacteria bacterium]|nr:methyltransferase [Alphaproteobacteria bacterium]
MSEGLVSFIVAQTKVATAPLVPEIRLHLASEVTPLWHATEATLARDNLPPPYWAFAWPGGQALSRHVLDHPDSVRGRRVLDFAAGCGIGALAAIRAGATTVSAAEIDRVAAAAMTLNARLNKLTIEVVDHDLTGTVDDVARRWDVVLAGDVFYERPMAERVEPWLRDLARRGVRVLVADPGRAYVPKSGLAEIGRYTVPTSRDLEDREFRETVVYSLTG